MMLLYKERIMSSLISVMRPAQRREALVYDGVCVVAASLLLALLAQCQIPLWFTPVPVTLQTFGLMLIAAMLGSKRGTLAVVAYLIEGSIGLPFFAGGTAGIAVFGMPTAGYLLSFVPATYLMGAMLERGWKGSYLKTLLTFMIGSALILIVGASWLAFLVGGMQAALVMGVYPFIIGSALKSVAAASLVRLKL